MTTNELKLAQAFRDAGIEQIKAETIAQTIFDAIRDNVATKSDLQFTEQALRNELQLMEQRLKIWGGGIAVASVTTLLVALHYWPPHG